LPTNILVAPAGRRVGLTTACLGLVRALDRQGVRVSFIKPIANREVSQSAELVALGAHILPAKSVPIHIAEELLAAGDDQTLMEHVVEVAGKAALGADVLIVEGMNPEPGIVHASRVNELMLKALDAELVLIAAPRSQNPVEVADAIAIAARGYGARPEGRQVGCILNRVCIGAAGQQSETETIGQAQGGCADCEGVAPFTEMEASHRKALQSVTLRPLAVVPCSTDLAAPRVLDVAQALMARVVFAGEIRTRRVSDVGLCAANAERAAACAWAPHHARDRSDIMMAAALSVQSGTRCRRAQAATTPTPRRAAVPEGADTGCLLAVDESRLRGDARGELAPDSADDRTASADDEPADRIDIEWVKGFARACACRAAAPHPAPLTEQAPEPAAHRPARGRRLRTVAAAAIVENRGIADACCPATRRDPKRRQLRVTSRRSGGCRPAAGPRHWSRLSSGGRPRA
jgi:phosphate acetyltransferase